MTAEELKRLADIVEPGAKWRIGGGGVFYEGPGAYDFDNIYFNPSLTGEDWQQAQALRVIVAAFNLSDRANLTKQTDSGRELYRFGYIQPTGRRLLVDKGLFPDLLESACAALLSGGGR